MRTDEDLQLARQQEAIAKTIQEEPETETWINQEYGEQDIDRELRNLENQKAHGSDGGNRRRIQRNPKMGNKTITRIANSIKTGQKFLKTGHMEP